MSGVRSSKTVGGTTYTYTTLSGLVMQQTDGTQELYFLYDDSNQPYALVYKSSATATPALYYYLLNVQGDVIGLLNASGTIVARYSYDPWGVPTVMNSSGTVMEQSTFIGNINPLRYRGYYYDTETGFYYLQSRYYDPAVGRFISADTYASTGQGFIGCNMFAYCGNNPACRVEIEGRFWRELEELGKRTTEVAIVVGSLGAAIGLVAGAIGFTVGTGGAGAASIPIAIAAANAMVTTAAVSATIGLVAAASGNVGGKIENSGAERKRGISKQDSDIWNSFDRVKNQSYRRKGHGHNRYYYDWDYTHNEIEVYNYKGKHVGVMDPATGKMIKPAVPGRTLF